MGWILSALCIARLKLLEFLSLPHCQMWQQDVTAVVTYRRMEQLALWRSFCKSTYRCDFVYEKFPEPIPRQMQRKHEVQLSHFCRCFFCFGGCWLGEYRKTWRWLIYGNAYWTPQVAMPWPMTSPWSSGRMHLRGWANVAIHCFKLQLKMKRIYSSFTAQILGANQEYQTKKHRINWSYEKSIKKYIYSVSNSTCLGLNLLLKP